MNYNRRQRKKCAEVNEGPDPQKAIRKAMNLLLYRPRSEMELQDKLREAGFEDESVSHAMSYVRSFGYLNDRRFAENYVLTYQHKKSRMVLKMDLRAKGVDEIYIENALEAIPVDEKQIMMELLLKKSGHPHRLDDKEYRRCSAFLARKGYAVSDIAQVIRSYQEMSEEE